MRRAKPFHEKLATIFKIFEDIMPELIRIEPNNLYPGKYWSILKLYFLATYIHGIYTPIVKKYFPRFYFLDVLSSSGLNYISMCNDCPNEGTIKCKTCVDRERIKTEFPGSTLIAGSAKIPFSKVYGIDKSDKNTQVLERRLQHMKNTHFPDLNFQAFTGDCNRMIDAALADMAGIRGRYHFLAFVDNEGLNVTWETVEKLLKADCDIIINYPTSSIPRVYVKSDSVKTVNAFFGFDAVGLKTTNYESLMSKYLEQIRKLRPKSRVEIIPIRTGMGYHYDLIIIAKDGPYWKSIDHIRKEISNHSAESIERMIGIIKGRQSPLFGSEDEPEESAQPQQ